MTKTKLKLFTIFRVVLISFAAFVQAASNPVFVEKNAEVGLDKLPNGRAACSDFNNDGWVDLYVAGVIWFNNEGKCFNPVRIGKGSAIAADFDNDGFVDIFSYTHLKLYRNIDGKRFEEFAIANLPEKHVSTGASWADLNGNGYLDIYVGGYEDWDAGITYSDFILFNEGGKSFRFAKNDTGNRARGVAACDFNNSGYIDIYVSNYRLQPNLLLVGDGNGILIDKAQDFNAIATAGKFKGGHTIGSVWADFDNDSYFDLFAANFAHRDARGNQPQSVFLRNTGAAGCYRFIELHNHCIDYQESYAHPAVGDFDNDGHIDLFITTVYETASFGKKNYPVLYRNEGEWKFTDVTKQKGLANTRATSQALWADFNNDGYLDLVAGGKLFVNQGGNNNWLKVFLVGDGEKINTSAIGSQVRIELENGVLTRQVEAGSGEGNQNSPVLHFGLGKRDKPVDVEIAWLGKEKQLLKAVELNQAITVLYKPRK
jgi:enediyne biosynthesis protein E4